MVFVFFYKHVSHTHQSAILEKPGESIMLKKMLEKIHVRIYILFLGLVLFGSPCFSLEKPITTTLAAHTPTNKAASKKEQPADKKAQQTAKNPEKKKSTQARSSKKHGGRCASKKNRRTKKKQKNVKELSYEELKELKTRLLVEKKTDAAIKCLEKMVAQCKDVAELKTCMLELADLLFDNGKLIAAEKMYTEFAKLYPGSEKIETVLYKAILCTYKSTLDARRDQTKTQETIELTKQFLDRQEVFTTYTQEVKQIQAACYAKLLESEENIVNFYLKRGSKRDMVAAENRIKDLSKDFMTIVPETESHVLALECSLAEKRHDKQLLTQKREELAVVLAKQEKLSTCPEITLALSKKAPSFTNRF
jgi:outer membrane assembly lipoprotein YfiO